MKVYVKATIMHTKATVEEGITPTSCYKKNMKTELKSQHPRTAVSASSAWHG